MIRLSAILLRCTTLAVFGKSPELRRRARKIVWAHGTTKRRRAYRRLLRTLYGDGRARWIDGQSAAGTPGAP